MRDRLAPPSQRRAYGGGGINRVQSPWRALSVPYISVMLGSILPGLLLAVVMPIVPPLGFLIFLCWRLMRPGLFPLWVGVPLGLFDDLFSGQPFGSAIFLWSLTMIVLEIIENRFPWRGFWQDWFTASIAIATYLLLAMVVSGAPLNAHLAMAVVPQVVLTILIYPLVSRLVAWLDRFRLSRARRIG